MMICHYDSDDEGSGGDSGFYYLGLFNPSSVSVSVSEPVPAHELELIGVDGSEKDKI